MVHRLADAAVCGVRECRVSVPRAPATIPDAATATCEEMVEAHLVTLNDTAVREAESVVEQFNQQLRTCRELCSR
jgi:3-methyladenine DNA glycosylase/8-oxoguanine DNA glycosylase